MLNYSHVRKVMYIVYVFKKKKKTESINGYVRKILFYLRLTSNDIGYIEVEYKLTDLIAKQTKRERAPCVRTSKKLIRL